jgi:ATPase subunit of ABC transporter with duplicated ATPase domains
LDNVAGWILELDRGRRHSVERELLFVAQTKEQRLAKEEKSQSERSEDFTKELEWIPDVTERSSNKAKAVKFLCH